MISETSLAKIIKDNMGIIEWKLSNRCNYNCVYCGVEIHKRKYPELESSEIFIRKLRENLTGEWLVQLGGHGEPFAAPNFLEIIKKIVLSGFYIGLTTNFSFSNKKFIKFFELAGERILFFNASLHYGQIDFQNFVGKLKEIMPFIKIPVEVSLVADPERLPELIKMGQELKRNDMRVVFQAERKGGFYKDYPLFQIENLRKLFGRVYGLDIRNSFNGMICPSAGINYFVLENNGRAYVCHPYDQDFGGKMKFSDEGYMGNILDGTFRLRTEKTVCRSSLCICSIPWRARGWKNMPR